MAPFTVEHLSPLRPRKEEAAASGGGVGECAFGRHTKGSEGGNMSSSWICRTSSRATSGKPSRGNATLVTFPEPEPDPGPAVTELQEAEEPPAASHPTPARPDPGPQHISSSEQDQETPTEETPTLLPSPDPEQAPGTALTELPDVDPPAACEQLTSAPGTPVVPGLVPHVMLGQNLAGVRRRVDTWAPAPSLKSPDSQMRTCSPLGPGTWLY
ncbi:hypothetical protein QTO34_009445 [Cnephaeus nilssonii]|uniref:Uncharacterized protein n=1 Tax=Cnephaeus nilssonii TaxID=3371016 RepID=A0AA40HHT7_CNENI|nr:hypothetical protein QTO34_009445 [Eptesicus nilssonii]